LGSETIWLIQGDSRVGVRADRGAIVTHVNVGGVELLYLDESTVESPSGAVRGGVPLLFPFAGELRDGRLTASGTEMPRHGFGRRKPWAPIARTSSSVTLRLRPDDETFGGFPYAFEATVEVEARARGVAIRLDVENRGDTAMPLAPGWHPYFPCPARQKRRVLRSVLHGVELPAPEPFECDVNVEAAADRRVAFELPTAGRIEIVSSENLRTLEVWTPAGAEFICVEPWVGPSNTINTAARVDVPPGGRAAFWLSIEQHSSRNHA